MLKSERKLIILSIWLGLFSVIATIVKAYFAGPLLVLFCMILMKNDCSFREMTVVMFIESIICFIPTNVWFSGFVVTGLFYTHDAVLRAILKICVYYIFSIIEIIIVEIGVNVIKNRIPEQSFCSK